MANHDHGIHTDPMGMGGSINGDPQNGWFIMEKPIVMDDEKGYPHDKTETSICSVWLNRKKSMNKHIRYHTVIYQNNKTYISILYEPWWNHQPIAIHPKNHPSPICFRAFQGHRWRFTPETSFRPRWCGVVTVRNELAGGETSTAWCLSRELVVLDALDARGMIQDDCWMFWMPWKKNRNGCYKWGWWLSCRCSECQKKHDKWMCFQLVMGVLP